MFDPQLKSTSFFKAMSWVQIFFLFLYLTLPAGIVQAQTFSVFSLPKPGNMVTTSEKFFPPLLKGISLHKENPLVFDFIIDPGNSRLTKEAVQNEGKKLIKYFLASLTIPENDLWVNLSPYENNKIIPQAFGETEMGRDLLAQDYILKQLSASLIYPEKDLGKDFWNRVYQKALAKYGTTDIPMSTFNKVWIIPEKAVILETEDTAYVVRSRLKVMMEQDYVALDKNRADEVLGTSRLNNEDVNQVSSISSEVVREIIIPEIEKEVNEGKNFSQLRQIYNSLILANWFKQNLKTNIINQVYSDQAKILGVDVEDKTDKEKIYQQYLVAYRQGVFNFIKEDIDPSSGESIPRKYFSGGAVFTGAAMTKAQEILSTRSGENTVDGLISQGKVNPQELEGTDGQGLQRVTVGVQGVRGGAGTVQRVNRDNASLSKSWSNRQVARKIADMFSQDELVALSKLFDQLSTAEKDQAKVIEGQINVILDKVNAQRLLAVEDNQQFYQKLQPAQRIWVEDKVTTEAREAALKSLGNGEVFIEIIAGGAASRMKDGLTALKIEGLEEKDYRIWNINVWDIIRKIKSSNPQISDPKLQKVLETLKSIQIPEHAKFYTAGQRSMFAISEGINNLTQDEAQRQSIRQNLKIVLHINEDIRESVVQDLINNQFFGFQPKNIILVNGGYGDSFVVSEGKVKVTREDQKVTWNHGFALTELDWYKGFTVDANGTEIPTKGSIFDELQNSGAKFGLARRINDGVLLHPQGAMDLDFLASAIQIQKDVPGANIVLEAMKNPTGQKGGLALATPEMGPFGLLLEGVNAKDQGIQDKLTQLTNDAAQSGGIPYNRFYFVYNLPEVRKSLEKNKGLPMTLKFKNGKITPEVPAGDVTQIKGVNAIIAQRQSDFLIDSGLIPSESAYTKGQGALIHDYKQPADLLMVTALTDYLDKNYQLPQDKRDAGMLTNSAEAQRVFAVISQSEFLPTALKGMDIERFRAELANPTSIDTGKLQLAREETDRVSRAIEQLRETGDISTQGNVKQSLENELSFWQAVTNFLNIFATGTTGVSTEAERSQVAQERADAFGQELQAKLSEQTGTATERPVVDVAADTDLKGGIDLNPANLKIELNKENGGIKVEFDPKLLEEIRQQGIEGFIPVIINVQPMKNALPLLSNNLNEKTLQTASI